MCRAPTEHACYRCAVPLCPEHVHLSCVTCGAPATEHCKRCGRGMCRAHRPRKRDRRCADCEDQLLEKARGTSAGNSPVRAGDLVATGGLCGGAFYVVLSHPALATALGAAAMTWPVGKMAYLRLRLRARAEQLRPEFIRTDTQPSQASCYPNPST